MLMQHATQAPAALKQLPGVQKVAAGDADATRGTRTISLGQV